MAWNRKQQEVGVTLTLFIGILTSLNQGDCRLVGNHVTETKYDHQVIYTPSITRPVPEDDEYFDLADNPEELERQIIAMREYLFDQMKLRENGSRESHRDKNEKWTKDFPDLSSFRGLMGSKDYVSEQIKKGAICSGCQVYVGVLMKEIRERGDSTGKPESLGTFTKFTCEFFELAEEEVCEGITERFLPTFYYIVEERPNLRSPLFCGNVLQSIGCKAKFSEDHDWNIDESLRDPRIKPKPLESGLLEEPEVEREREVPAKILHLTDIHIDPLYKYGTLAECPNGILCCQERYGYPEPDSEGITPMGAGYYGDNRTCDAPIRLLELTLENIRINHQDIDVIYMTGDIVPHNVWYTEREENEQLIESVSDVIKSYFPTAKLIPCFGNHESHPVNFYSPPQGRPQGEGPPGRRINAREAIPYDLRTDWVQEAAYKAWGPEHGGPGWIPLDQKATFLKDGFYSIPMGNKFRAIIINSNVCYGFNLWNLHSPQDPGGQLKWLNRELAKSELRNETVHILGHVPPGHEDCDKVWSREFYKIVSRYRNIVRGQFYGHTHFDEFRLYYDPDDIDKAINVQWIGPSLTPYRIQNPGYRIYYTDPSSGDIVDYETWIFDLWETNVEYNELQENEYQRVLKLAPEWYPLYRPTAAYGLDDVRPQSLHKLVRRMTKDDQLFQQYHQYLYKSKNPDRQCNTLCKKRVLCGIVRRYLSDDSKECIRVQKSIDGIVLPFRRYAGKRLIWS